MCEHEEHRRHHGDEQECCGGPAHEGHRMHLAGAGCGCGGHWHRRFFTREERIARLKEYLESLRTEAQAVEEMIAELQAAG